MNSRDTFGGTAKKAEKKARRKKHEEKSLGFSLKITSEPRIHVGSSLFSGGKLCSIGRIARAGNGVKDKGNLAKQIAQITAPKEVINKVSELPAQRKQ